MSKPIVVAYDASDAGRRAVELATQMASSSGASLIVAHVLEWSPYSFLTPEEIEERHKRRSEELARAETHVVAPIMADLAAKGISAQSEIRYGNVADTLSEIATAKDAAHIVVGRTGHQGLATRLLGAVTGSLAQIAPVPVTIVP